MKNYVGVAEGVRVTLEVNSLPWETSSLWALGLVEIVVCVSDLASAVLDGCQI
jgi:hypothetical protein